MSEQHAQLIKVEALVVKLNEHFGSDFTVGTIKTLRDNKTISAVDVRTPGTKIARWKYNFEDVIKALEKIQED